MVYGSTSAVGNSQLVLPLPVFFLGGGGGIHVLLSSFEKFVSLTLKGTRGERSILSTHLMNMNKFWAGINGHFVCSASKKTDIAEVTVRIPLKPWYYNSSNCLNWKIYCYDHSSLWSIIADQYEFHLYFTSFHCSGRYEINQFTSLPMCGFTAQLVEYCTGVAEVTGLNPVEALIFFRLLPSNCLNWKIYRNDHSSLSNFIIWLQ